MQSLVENLMLCKYMCNNKSLLNMIKELFFLNVRINCFGVKYIYINTFFIFLHVSVCTLLFILYVYCSLSSCAATRERGEYKHHTQQP